MSRVLSNYRPFAARLLLVLCLAGCSQPTTTSDVATEPVAAPTVAPIPVTEVRRGDLIETIIVNGQFTPAREVVLFFRQPGRLKNITVSSGDKVKTGQVMAELEVGSLASDLDQAEIAMRKAQIKLEQARSKGADRFEVQSAQFDHEAARITYEKLAQQLSDSKLVAPFDGVISETAGRPGEPINAFTPTITVADPTEIQVTAEVANANDINRLTLGMPASVIIDKMPGVRIPLSIVQTPTTAPSLPNGSPVPANLSRRFKLSPTQALPKEIELGMLGRVTVVLREKKGVLLVKSSAVRTAGPRTYVQVVQDGRRRDVDVELGIIGQLETEIVIGVREGDKIAEGITGGQAPPTPARKP